MDLNELLFQHQVALIGMAEAVRKGTRPDPQNADRFADKLLALRAGLGVPTYAGAAA